MGYGLPDDIVVVHIENEHALTFVCPHCKAKWAVSQSKPFEIGDPLVCSECGTISHLKNIIVP